MVPGLCIPYMDTQKVSETKGFGLELTSRAPFYNLVHVVGNQIEQVLQDAVSKRNTWDGTAQNTSLIYHSWLFFFDPSNEHIAVNIHYYYYYYSF